MIRRSLATDAPRRSRLRHRVLAVLSACAVLASCSLSTDSEPRDVLDEEEPTIVNTTGGPSPEAGTGSTVYFLTPDDGSGRSLLVAVSRAPASNAGDLLSILLEGPTVPEQQELGVRSAIPAGTRVLASSVDGQGTLTLDLSTEFLANAGDVLLDAVAQVVFTASESTGVRRVRLLVEGEAQDWPTSTGSSMREPLSIYDFLDRAPDSSVLPNPGTVGR